MSTNTTSGASYGVGVIPTSQFQASATLLLTVEIQSSGGLRSYQIPQKLIRQLKRWNEVHWQTFLLQKKNKKYANLAIYEKLFHQK